MTSSPSSTDNEVNDVIMQYLAADPDGSRTALTIRKTFDQAYDGQNTGRYRLDQLSKTEKAHIGSLIEINLRREFHDLFQDGEVLDFRVGDIEIDCKFSIKFGGWMIPREAVGKLLLLVTAKDESSEWGVGVVRATEGRLRSGANQDAKRGLLASSYDHIEWAFFGKDLPENVLLHIDTSDATRILSQSSGQARVNELLRTVLNTVIPRGTIATVAQQSDYMKRVRASGGARSALAKEGILVIGGTYSAHRAVARDLGSAVPKDGDTIAVRVVQTTSNEPDSVFLDGGWWRLASDTDQVAGPAPALPRVTPE